MYTMIQAKLSDNKQISDPSNLINNNTPHTVRKRKREDANLLETKKLDSYFSIPGQYSKENIYNEKTPNTKKTKSKLHCAADLKIQMTFKDGVLSRKVHSQPATCPNLARQKSLTQSQTKSTQPASLKALKREFFRKFSTKFENNEFSVFSSLFNMIGDHLKDAGFSIRTFERVFVSTLALFLSSSFSQQMHAIFRPSAMQEVINNNPFLKQ